MKLVADFALVTGIIGTILILLLLFKKPNRELAQKILITIFVVLFFVVLGFYSILHDIQLLVYLSFILYGMTGYILGPLFYLYIKSLYHSEENFLKRNYIHFIPFLFILFLFYLPMLISRIIDAFIFSYLEVINENDWDNIETIFQAFFFIFYCIISLLLLNKYQNSLRQNYSNLQEKDLNWVKYLIMGVLLAMTIDVVVFSYQLIFGEIETSFPMGYLTIFPLMLMIVYLGYYGLTQSKILLPKFIVNENSENPVHKDPTSKTSHHLTNATVKEIDQLKHKLKTVLKQDKPYLDEDLTLGGLAAMISTTDKKLSALLNHFLHISFYDLINQCRVEEVKVKMANPKFNHYTLLAIAFDSGFKSKTSFNRIFKKETGESPSQYKASLNKSS